MGVDSIIFELFVFLLIPTNVLAESSFDRGKNIANEYVQYRSRLERGINCEKLLGMIIYKNYYPQDFANLHDCNGKLYRLLNLKEEFIGEKIKVVEKDNEQKLALKQSSIRDRHLREVELRRLYLEAYRDRLENPH